MKDTDIRGSSGHEQQQNILFRRAEMTKQTEARGDWEHQQHANILFLSADKLERASSIVIIVSLVLLFMGILFSINGILLFNPWLFILYVGIPLTAMLLLLTLAFRFRARYLSKTNKMLGKDLLILVLLAILITTPIMIAALWHPNMIIIELKG